MIIPVHTLDEKNSCVAETGKFTLDLLTFCKKIEPFVNYYRRQIKSFSITAHNILKIKLTEFYHQINYKTKAWHYYHTGYKLHRVSLWGNFKFLHNQRNNALHKAVKSMDSKKSTIQCNKLKQLENSVVMYGMYNAETLEQLTNTVHCIHNTASSNERLFAGQQSSLSLWSLYANAQGI